MPEYDEHELIRIKDDEVAEDYLVLSGDAPGTDSCVSFRGYSAGNATDVILNRTDVGRAVAALTEWLEETVADEPATGEPSDYPETSPAVFVPDYDAPNETGRALRLSAADGFIFVECGRETVTAADGDASQRTWKVEGSTGVHANDLIRALAHLLPLTPGLEVGVVTAR
mgnify:CR=1 FL=1